MAKAKNNPLRPSAIVIRNIDALRAYRGWSKTEIAKKLDISYSSYQSYLRGDGTAGLEILDRAVIIFGVSARQLLDPVDKPRTEAV